MNRRNFVLVQLFALCYLTLSVSLQPSSPVSPTLVSSITGKAGNRCFRVDKLDTLCEEDRLPMKNPCFPLPTRNRTVCAPYLSIMGMPKSGTSALRYFLRRHDNFIMPYLKENCARYEDSAEFFLISFPVDLQKHQLTVDVCMERTNPIIELYSKQIYIFRNKPDWLWSAFNYWCFPDMDLVGCSEMKSNEWAINQLHNRSPERFHSLIEDFLQKKKEGRLNEFKPVKIRDMLIDERWSYTKLYKKCTEKGKDNCLVLSAHELYETPKSVYERVLKFLDVPLINIPDSSFKVSINTQKQKGEGRVASYDQGMGKSIRPMLNITYQWIKEIFKDDCKQFCKLSEIHLDCCDSN